MSQSEGIGEVRAAMAIEDIKDRADQSLLHMGRYSASYAGGSCRSVLTSRFAKYHDIEPTDQLVQFFDASTGALVILPESSMTSPESGGDD